jgi:abortive infection bacteriophage resistance protein
MKTKEFLSLDEQLELLNARGLVIDNKNATKEALERIGYYRLSGYWYQFRIREEIEGEVITHEEFLPNTNIEQVLDVYKFDQKLRFVLFQALEAIEVSLRFHIGHALGAIEPYALDHADIFQSKFLEPQLDNCSDADSRSEHQKLKAAINRRRNRSKEDFVIHHVKNYNGRMPIWAITEIMDFNHLLQLLKGIREIHLNSIAKNIGLTDKSGDGIGGLLLNWLEVLVVLRNVVAHHSRLWNRTLNRKLRVKHLARIEETKHIFLLQNELKRQGGAHPEFTTQKIYGALVMVLTLTKKLKLGDSARQSIRGQIEQAPYLAFVNQMGFFSGWEKESIWAAPD